MLIGLFFSSFSVQFHVVDEARYPSVFDCTSTNLSEGALWELRSHPQENMISVGTAFPRRKNKCRNCVSNRSRTNLN